MDELTDRCQHEFKYLLFRYFMDIRQDMARNWIELDRTEKNIIQLGPNVEWICFIMSWLHVLVLHKFNYIESLFCSVVLLNISFGSTFVYYLSLCFVCCAAGNRNTWTMNFVLLLIQNLITDCFYRMFFSTMFFKSH